MSLRKAGDLCPQCKKGHLEIHFDREKYERQDKLESGGHSSWKCDSCGHIFKDYSRNISG